MAIMQSGFMDSAYFGNAFSGGLSSRGKSNYFASTVSQVMQYANIDTDYFGGGNRGTRIDDDVWDKVQGMMNMENETEKRYGL